ncbi:MAG: BolA family protein [Thioalkalivibrionaceae bacterium]
MELDAATIAAKLRPAFDDGDRIEVEGGGGKFVARIVSKRFEGLSRVRRHQVVYAAVREDIDSGTLHALSIDARTPAENAA